jgi:hypothetical protein
MASMRVVIRAVVTVFALVVALPASSAVSAARPVLVHPRWRVVVSELLYAGANDRYVGIVHGYKGGGQLTLIDEQPGQEEALTPPNCSRLNSPVDQLQLGGPWLMVGCGDPGTSDFTYMLYNIPGGQWTPFAISPQCPGFCHVVAVGGDWVKILSNDELTIYSPDIAYLQNIQTGSFVRDPVSSGGRIYDDLSAPSGSTPLCAPLRYPTFYYHSGPEPGSLAFYGPFALIANQRVVESPIVTSLRRCNSRLNLVIPSGTNQSGPLASSGAVIVTPDGKTLDGWLLPSLRRFVLTAPREIHVRPCDHISPGSPVIQRNEVIPAALTAGTIYVRPLCGTRLWAASLPSPESLVRCMVPNLKGKTVASARAAIRAAHCRIGAVAHAYSTQIKAGRVISQKPAPGKMRARGTDVQLVLSRR